MGMEPAAVYHLHDEQCELLYVGMSINPERRFKQHAAKRTWWNEVDPTKTAITWYADRIAAALVEHRDELTNTPRYGKNRPAWGWRRLAALKAEGYDTTPIEPPSQTV